MQPKHHITQHIRYGLTPLPFGTLLSSVATSYMLETLYAIQKPALKKGGNKFMTLLPSFNGNKTRTGKEIPTSRDYLITDVKRLATLDPNSQ